MKHKAFLTAATLALLTIQTTAQDDRPASRPVESESRPSDERADDLLRQGRDAMFRRDWTKAVELLRQAVDLAPQKTSYKLSLALAHRYGGDAEGAKGLLRQILETTPDHVEGGLQLAEILSQEGKHRDVVDVLTPLLAYRHDYMIFHLRARAAFALGDQKTARRDFEEAIRLNPRQAADHYQLANIYLAGNLFAMAAEAFTRALDLGFESKLLHYKLATACFNLRNYFGEIRVVVVKEGVAGKIDAGVYLIEAVPGQKDTFRAAPSGSAIFHLAKALEGGLERTPDVSFLEANIYLSASRYSRAHDMFKGIETTVAESERPLLYWYWAQSAFGIGQFDEYLRLLHKAIELDAKAYQPSLLDAYVRVADQKNESGDLEGYIKYLKLAIDHTPTSGTLHLKIGNAYEEAQLFADAVIHWRMVLDLDSEHPQRIELRNRIARHRSSGVEPPGKSE